MAIGINWAEVWKPVWKLVWQQVVGVTPPVQEGGKGDNGSDDERPGWIFDQYRSFQPKKKQVPALLKKAEPVLETAAPKVAALLVDRQALEARLDAQRQAEAFAQFQAALLTQSAALAAQLAAEEEAAIVALIAELL